MDTYLIIALIEWVFCVALTLLIFMLYREQEESVDRALKTRDALAKQAKFIFDQAAQIELLEDTPQSKYRKKCRERARR